MKTKIQLLATAAFTTAILAILPACLNAASVINLDFNRDISGPNPGTPPNPAAVLYSGTGPAADAGTTWNDGKIALTDTTTYPGEIEFSFTHATGGPRFFWRVASQ